MSQQTWDINHYRGDTFEEKEITILVNGSPLDLTGSSIIWQVRKERHIAPVLEKTSEVDGGLTINDPTAGKFKIDQAIIDFKGGNYFHDIQITLADGRVKTYIKGTFTMEDDTTWLTP